MRNSRRIFLLSSAAVLGVVGCGLELLPAAMSAPELSSIYAPPPNSPKLSFAKAKLDIDALVQSEIDRSQKDFNVKYSDPSNIREQVWDKTQLVLMQRYTPAEQPHFER